jgi:squalene-hopene/tetraprenyl-beta-curcumene cyclase
VLRYSSLHYFARKQTVKWLLQCQNENDNWSGYWMACHFVMTALLLEDFAIDDTLIRRCHATVETWAMKNDAESKQMQMSTSPTWHTALMLETLCNSDTPQNDDRLRRTADWIGATGLRPS